MYGGSRRREPILAGNMPLAYSTGAWIMQELGGIADIAFLGHRQEVLERSEFHGLLPSLSMRNVNMPVLIIRVRDMEAAVKGAHAYWGGGGWVRMRFRWRTLG